jgi:hypothetical protein
MPRTNLWPAVMAVLAIVGAPTIVLAETTAELVGKAKQEKEVV